ncbi:MAG: hypothetical protein IKB73_06840 [Ruminococcus sp.]|nr:hypothetical protein [Ruminococcus sp.]
MSLKDVLNRFALVSGLSQEDISKWVFVISDCIKFFESRTANRNFTESERARLVHACAVYAYYKYSMINFAYNSGKFKAGDVEITQSEDMIDKAHKMWQEEKREISDVFDFDDFAFYGVSS